MNVDELANAAARALQSGNFAEAEKSARGALALQEDEPRATEVLAILLLKDGKCAEAVNVLKPALESAEGASPLYNLMGHADAGLARYKSAIVYFQQAVQATPEDAMAWEHLGKAAYRLRRWKHARGAFEHCLELDPANADAAAGLARVEIHGKNYTRALELSSNAVAQHPEHLMARQAMAEASMRLGHYEQARNSALALTKLPGANDKANVVAFGLAGEAAEAQGNYDEAFASFTAMNQSVARAYRRGYERWQNTGGYETQRGITALAPLLAERAKTWRTEVRVPPIIYYIGFVNSGMSAFTNIMLRHPQLVSGRDRKQVRAWEELVWAEDAVERVAALTFEDMENLRQDFCQTIVDAEISLAPGQEIFDQRPFYTRHMSTLALVLPDAKYILAHRDPRDVIVSCFKHRSSPNMSMYEFLDVETAAHYYDVSMTAAIDSCDAYGLELVQLGYDQLWADTEGETRRILKYLGLPWDEALLGADGTLMDGAAKAPSIWRNYEAHLAPAMPILDKWVKYFGYD